jgi:hypothetical protein
MMKAPPLPPPFFYATCTDPLPRPPTHAHTLQLPDGSVPCPLCDQVVRQRVRMSKSAQARVKTDKNLQTRWDHLRKMHRATRCKGCGGEWYRVVCCCAVLGVRSRFPLSCFAAFQQRVVDLLMSAGITIRDAAGARTCCR